MRSLLLEYYVRSSVLGGRVVSQLNAQGRKVKTNVYAGGDEVIAEQQFYDSVEGVVWNVDSNFASRKYSLTHSAFEIYGCMK